MPESLICSRMSVDRIKTKEVIGMSKLLISTQVRENYGAHSWDGKGTCPQYWKSKGGNEYIVLDIDVNKASDIYESVKAQCESNDDYYTEYVIDWEVVANDLLDHPDYSEMGRWLEKFPPKVLEKV